MLFIMFITFHSVSNFKSYMHAWLGSLIGNIFKSALCVTATAKICPQNLQGPTIELLILRGLRGGGGGGGGLGGGVDF